MTIGSGTKVLYPEATGLERAWADVDADRLQSIDAKALIRAWDPVTVPSGEAMELLAYAFGVNLWEDGWDELTKREWLAKQWAWQAMRGRMAGFRQALEINRFKIVDSQRPPGGMFISPFSKADEDAWIRQMPQLRIYWDRRTGTAAPGEHFISAGFIGDDVIGLDDGWVLWGRKAVLRQNGVDTQLTAIDTSTISSLRDSTNVDQVVVPGLSLDGLIIGEDCIGEDAFIGVDNKPSYTITTEVDIAYQHSESTLSLTTVTPGLQPQNVRYELESDIGNGGPFGHIGADFIGDAILADGDPAGMLAYTMYLIDPSIALPMTQGTSFIGVDRIGVRRNTLELLIDLNGFDHAPSWYIDLDFIGDAFLMPDDRGAEERAIRAVDAARALKQQVLVSFETKQRLRATDRITATTRINEWRPTIL